MASFQKPKIPAFAKELDPRINQLHSSAYHNLSQLREGDVLIVGAGNSGAEIGMEVVRAHTTWIAGRDTGHIPFRIEGLASKLLLTPLVIRFIFHRVLTMGTPIGRKARAKMIAAGGPLIRTKPNDMAAVGIRRVPKVAGVRDGLPLLEDGRVLDVTNVIWCTGYHPGFSWINLPVFDLDSGSEQPMHKRGIVSSVPGLYFVGLEFLYSLSSTMVHGVGRDAEYIANAIAAREAVTHAA
jgi:putative flavoprotein involved in K+ transport